MFEYELKPPKPENLIPLQFIFVGTRLLVRIEGEETVIPETFKVAGSEIKRRIHLGSLDGRPCEAVEVTREAGLADQVHAFRDLRSLMGLLEEERLRIAGIASQILDWDRNNQYCGRCGSLTRVSESERSRSCPACSLTLYPRISPAIIVAVTRGTRILLAHNRRHKAPVYSIIAGFVEPGESLEECVRRELFEEVAVRVGEIRYVGSQPWPFPDSLMVGFRATYDSGEIRVDGKEILEAGWFGKEDLPQVPPHGTIARKIIDSVLSEDATP